MTLDVGFEEACKQSHGRLAGQAGEEPGYRFEGAEERSDGLRRRFGAGEQVEDHEGDAEHEQDLLDPANHYVSKSQGEGTHTIAYQFAPPGVLLEPDAPLLNFTFSHLGRQDRPRHAVASHAVFSTHPSAVVPPAG